MNYHIEHHMYAAVPFHNLKKLHKLVRDDGAPVPNSSLLDAWKEIMMVQAHCRDTPDEAFDTFSRSDEPKYVPLYAEAE